MSQGWNSGQSSIPRRVEPSEVSTSRYVQANERLASRIWRGDRGRRRAGIGARDCKQAMRCKPPQHTSWACLVRPCAPPCCWDLPTAGQPARHREAVAEASLLRPSWLCDVWRQACLSVSSVFGARSRPGFQWAVAFGTGSGQTRESRPPWLVPTDTYASRASSIYEADSVGWERLRASTGSVG